MIAWSSTPESRRNFDRQDVFLGGLTIKNRLDVDCVKFRSSVRLERPAQVLCILRRREKIERVFAVATTIVIVDSSVVSGIAPRSLIQAAGRSSNLVDAMFPTPPRRA
jgi:hypothetical protein